MSQLIACPDCEKQLQVPEDLLGSTVQCPECKHTFTAAIAAPVTIAEPPVAKTTVAAQTDGRASRYDDEHDHGADTVRASSHSRFRCPFCGSREVPTTRSQISAGGWVVFVVMVIFCFPLFWIGLLMTEEYRVCAECSGRLGG